jgi:hypothetical protein
VAGNRKEHHKGNTVKKLLGIVMYLFIQFLLVTLFLYSMQFGPVAIVLIFIFDLLANLLMVLAYEQYRRIQYEGNDMA